MPWSWVNTEYSIHRVLHHPKFDYLPLPASLSALSGPSWTQFSNLLQLLVNQWIESQLPLHMPPDVPPPDWPPPDSLPQDWLPPVWLPSDQSPPDEPPPTTPPIFIDHGLQAYLPTCSILAPNGVSEFSWSRPPSASPNLLDHGPQVHLGAHYLGLQVHLQTCSIPASKCIPKLTRSQSPSASSNTLNHSLQVNL